MFWICFIVAGAYAVNRRVLNVRFFRGQFVSFARKAMPAIAPSFLANAGLFRPLPGDCKTFKIEKQYMQRINHAVAERA